MAEVDKNASAMMPIGRATSHEERSPKQMEKAAVSLRAFRPGMLSSLKIGPAGVDINFRHDPSFPEESESL